MDASETWIEELPTNRYGRRSLTLPVAREIVSKHQSGWYVAPYSLGWTVGKAAVATTQGRYFHIVKDDGEPLFFDTVDAAVAFLRRELDVQRAPIVNCVAA